MTPLLDSSFSEAVTPALRLTDDGPLMLRGVQRWVDPGGEHHEVYRPLVAICCCGLSQRKPWCDGTHQFGA